MWGAIPIYELFWAPGAFEIAEVTWRCVDGTTYLGVRFTKPPFLPNSGYPRAWLYPGERKRRETAILAHSAGLVPQPPMFYADAPTDAQEALTGLIHSDYEAACTVVIPFDACPTPGGLYTLVLSQDWTSRWNEKIADVATGSHSRILAGIDAYQDTDLAAWPTLESEGPLLPPSRIRRIIEGLTAVISRIWRRATGFLAYTGTMLETSTTRGRLKINHTAPVTTTPLNPALPITGILAGRPFTASILSADEILDVPRSLLSIAETANSVGNNAEGELIDDVSAESNALALLTLDTGRGEKAPVLAEFLLKTSLLYSAFDTRYFRALISHAAALSRQLTLDKFMNIFAWLQPRRKREVEYVITDYDATLNELTLRIEYGVWAYSVGDLIVLRDGTTPFSLPIAGQILRWFDRLEIEDGGDAPVTRYYSELKVKLLTQPPAGVTIGFSGFMSRSAVNIIPIYKAPENQHDSRSPFWDVNQAASCTALYRISITLPNDVVAVGHARFYRDGWSGSVLYSRATAIEYGLIYGIPADETSALATYAVNTAGPSEFINMMKNWVAFNGCLKMTTLFGLDDR